MRKNVFGRRFKRDKNERTALFKSLISSLVLKERIITTQARAKAIKADADKIVTKVKKNKDLAKRSLGGLLNKEALEKLINDLAPRFANRNGGYTRIIRVGKRLGDDAMEVLIEWTEKGGEALRSPRQLDDLQTNPKNKSLRDARKSLSKNNTRATIQDSSRAKAPRAKRKNKKEKKK